MNGNFNKIKKSFLVRSAIIVALAGICAALAVCGILLICFKLLAVDFDWWYYILIGIVVCGLVGYLTYMLTRPTDKGVARKLDEDYSLEERAETMVEFADTDTAIAELQRRDAIERISSLKRKPSASTIVRCSVASVVALALFVTGLVLPTKKVNDGNTPIIGEDDGNKDVAFTPTNYQLQRIEQLIEEVNASTLETSTKVKYVATLSQLLANLKVTSYESEKNNYVITAMNDISGTTVAVNSFNDIAAALGATTNVSALSLAFVNSTSVYSNGSGGKKISSISELETKAEQNDDDIKELIAERVDVITTAVTSYTTALEFTQNFESNLSPYISDLSTALNTANSWTEDELYASIVTYRDALSEVLSAYNEGGITLNGSKSMITNAGDSFVTNSSVALSKQTYVCMMGEYINEILSELFGISLTSDDGNNSNSSSSGSGGSDDSASSGGAGKGNLIYGSNDVIFYPEDGDYVIYGTVLNGVYYPTVNDLIRSGDLSEETNNVLYEYFQKLISGLGDSQSQDE
jgi:hypothetical protein